MARSCRRLGLTCAAGRGDARKLRRRFSELWTRFEPRFSIEALNAGLHDGRWCQYSNRFIHIALWLCICFPIALPHEDEHPVTVEINICKKKKAVASSLHGAHLRLVAPVQWKTCDDLLPRRTAKCNCNVTHSLMFLVKNWSYYLMLPSHSITSTLNVRNLVFVGDLKSGTFVFLHFTWGPRRTFDFYPQSRSRARCT